MPQQQEKQKQQPQKVSTGPSAGLLQRIFGFGVMTPEIEEGIRIAQSENPNLAPVKPYGMLSRMMQPQAMGYTSPGRTIYLNPRTMEGQNPQDVADTLVHEQEHVKQMQNRGYGPVREFLHEALSGIGGGGEPYHRRPDEIAAFGAETERRSKMGRMQSATPSFTTGEMRVADDIRLYTPRKKVETGPSSTMLAKVEKKNAGR